MGELGCHPFLRMKKLQARLVNNPSLLFAQGQLLQAPRTPDFQNRQREGVNPSAYQVLLAPTLLSAGGGKGHRLYICAIIYLLGFQVL